MIDPPCPVCGAPAKLAKALPANFLKRALTEYYREQLPDTVHIPSYDLMKCPRCTAEFSEPMLPGDSSFYAWIARQPGYYPESRWEWGEVISEIKKRHASCASVLEVGCGSGSFLEVLKSEPSISAVGLDTEPGAIARCREKSFEAYAEDIEIYLSRDPSRRFDFVVAFHCLEHVSQPKKFLQAMFGAMKPGGRVFVSTPYSPMSFETGWFDPLNHPPHHMTRWNSRMYEELAAQIGVEVRLHMPEAASIFQRTKCAILLRKFGPRHAPSKLRILAALFSNPVALFAEIKKQRSREKHAAVFAADVVLAEFSMGMHPLAV